MRVRVFVVGFVVAIVLILALVTQARGGETPESGELLVTPTATVPTHMPYDPFRPLETLPEYPGEPRSRGLRSRAVLTKPTGIDLDVTYINRTPMHNRYEVWYTADGKPYLRPGTESDKRWPDYGEIVTFTAHIINKGTTASGVFAFKWFIDDVEVFSGTHSSLAPEEEGTV